MATKSTKATKRKSAARPRPAKARGARQAGSDGGLTLHDVESVRRLVQHFHPTDEATLRTLGAGLDTLAADLVPDVMIYLGSAIVRTDRDARGWLSRVDRLNREAVLIQVPTAERTLANGVPLTFVHRFAFSKGAFDAWTRQPVPAAR